SRCDRPAPAPGLHLPGGLPARAGCAWDVEAIRRRKEGRYKPMQLPVRTTPPGERVSLTRPEYALWRRRLPSWLVEVWLRAQTVLLYLFLYTPSAVVFLYSFNHSRRVTVCGGFTTARYQSACTSPDL